MTRKELADLMRETADLIERGEVHLTRVELQHGYPYGLGIGQTVTLTLEGAPVRILDFIEGINLLENDT